MSGTPDDHKHEKHNAGHEVHDAGSANNLPSMFVDGLSYGTVGSRNEFGESKWIEQS